MAIATNPKKGKEWLLNLSIIACIISLVIFVYFLVVSGRTTEEVQASSYSPEQVIAAVNKQRINNNLESLVESQKLSIAAQNKADDMKKRNYFSHVYANDGTKWSDFIQDAGYEYTIAGENLANGFYSVNDMVEAWMNSPTHRENIVNTKVDETGVGISYGELEGNPTIFVVQMFGKEKKLEN